MNTSIVPNLPWREGKILAIRLTLDEVKANLENGFESAVGHQGSADFLSKLLGFPVPLVRKEVKVEDGDILVCFKLKTRLPEGVVLTDEEMKKYEWEFLLLHF